MMGSYLSKAFLYLLKLLDILLRGKFVRLSHIAFIMHIIAPVKCCYKALVINNNFTMIIIIENIFNLFSHPLNFIIISLL